MFQKSIFIFVLSTIIHLTYGFSFGIGIKETKCFYDYIEEGSMLEGYYKTTPPDTQGRRIQLTVCHFLFFELSFQKILKIDINQFIINKGDWP